MNTERTPGSASNFLPSLAEFTSTKRGSDEYLVKTGKNTWEIQTISTPDSKTRKLIANSLKEMKKEIATQVPTKPEDAEIKNKLKQKILKAAAINASNYTEANKKIKKTFAQKVTQFFKKQTNRQIESQLRNIGRAGEAETELKQLYNKKREAIKHAELEAESNLNAAKEEFPKIENELYKKLNEYRNLANTEMKRNIFFNSLEPNLKKLSEHVETIKDQHPSLGAKLTDQVEKMRLLLIPAASDQLRDVLEEKITEYEKQPEMHHTDPIQSIDTRELLDILGTTGISLIKSQIGLDFYAATKFIPKGEERFALMKEQFFEGKEAIEKLIDVEKNKPMPDEAKIEELVATLEEMRETIKPFAKEQLKSDLKMYESQLKSGTTETASVIYIRGRKRDFAEKNGYYEIMPGPIEGEVEAIIEESEG